MRISSPPPQQQRERCRAWQNDGCSGLSRSWVAAGPLCPNSKKDSPTLQQARILSQIPQIPDTQRRCPSAMAIVLGRQMFFELLCCFRYTHMGLLYPKSRLFNNICFLSLTFFTHLTSWIKTAVEHHLKCSKTKWESFGPVVPLERYILNRV